VLETELKRREEKEKELAKVQPTPTLTRHTGLSGGAPDRVRCARLVSGKMAALGNRWRCTAIIHRTVWWCTELSGEPTVTNGRPRNLRATRALLQRSAGAPDCLVCTGQCPVRQSAQRSNGRICQIWKEIMHRQSTGPVRCATR
jgi:hypothetical protein